MATPEERRAANQGIFREANEILQHRQRNANDPLSFMCECWDEACKENISLSFDEYEHVRSQPVWFAVAPGHQGPDEKVREDGERFLLVEKVDLAAELVEAQDPRR